MSRIRRCTGSLWRGGGCCSGLAAVFGLLMWLAAAPACRGADGEKAGVDAAGPQPASAKPKREVVGPPDITFVDDDADGAATQGGASPFGSGQTGVSRKDAVPGYLELSTGLKVPGLIYTTRAKRLKIYNIDRERYEYVPVAAISRIEGTVEWERMDKEWRFKEAGNPEKIYSGREYPVRKTAWTLTLRNDHRIRGHVLGQPLYVEHNGKAERFLLHDREKGPMGGTLAGLLYIKRVEFGPEAYNQAVEELKAKAEAAGKK